MAKEDKLISELKQIHKELKSYRRLVEKSNELSEPQQRYKESLREKLVCKVGGFKDTIIQLTDKQVYTQFGITRDFWDDGLLADDSDNYLQTIKTALNFCIDSINMAIGKLEYEILGPEAKSKVEQTVTILTPIQLFDAMQFHPKVIKVSRLLFKDKHYAQAIFEAFKAVENFVQDKSDVKLYGTNLMETVFNEENPIIKVPEAGHYYKSVQKGFKNLFIGATQAIRNPKAHKEIVQNDPFITLEYLGFASFLLKRIDYWKADIS